MRPLVSGTDHYVMYAGDPESIIRFYRDVLGCELDLVDEWRRGDLPIFRIVVTPDQYVNVHAAPEPLHPRAHSAAPGGLDVCFSTWMSPDEVVAHLHQHGVEIELGPVERRTARGEPSLSVYCRDPDGNLVELMSKR